MWLFVIGEGLAPLALAAMLAIYWKSGAAVTLTANLRRLAIVAAAVLGGFCAALPLCTALAFLALGMRLSYESVYGWRLLFLLSQLALGLFLVALVRPTARPDHGDFRLLRKAAAAAVIAGATTLATAAFNAFTTAQAVLVLQGHEGPYYEGPAAIQAIMGAVIDLIPEVCRLLIPAIVYMGLKSLRNEANLGDGAVRDGDEAGWQPAAD
jgi:hypothetical protein